MGSGVLKTLSSDKVSHHQFLHVFSCGGHSPKPFVCLLLWGLGIRSCRGYFFFINTPIIHDGFASLALSWGPVSLVAVRFVPRVLGAIATQVPLFMTGVTLNFA